MFVYINIIISSFSSFISVCCCLFCFVSAFFIENPVVSSSSSSSSSHTHASVSKQVTQSRRRQGRHPTRPTLPPHVPNLTKKQSLHTKSSLHIHNRELAFRQLAEQLWAAGLPSSMTACSTSVRSRCSSAPPSERGEGEDEIIKVNSNNDCDDEEENIVDWDEPDKPDDGNSSRKKTMPILIIYYFTYAYTHVAYMTIDYACFARSNT
jgi:hypothetical protein